MQDNRKLSMACLIVVPVLFGELLDIGLLLLLVRFARDDKTIYEKLEKVNRNVIHVFRMQIIIGRKVNRVYNHDTLTGWR